MLGRTGAQVNGNLSVHIGATVKPKRILILSYFYEPDLSACSFRTAALVRYLADLYPDIEIDVVSTAPSRYASYKPEVKSRVASNVNISRVDVADVGFGFMGELFSFAKYAFHIRSFISDKEYDLVYATSAKLGTSVLARVIAKKKAAKLYLDIRDLLSDNMEHMFHPCVHIPLLPIIRKLEQYAFSGANRINAVSGGFTRHLETFVSSDCIRQFTNGIDDGFSTLRLRKRSDRPLRIVYAGNLGTCQALHKIVPELAQRANVRITVVGDGRDAKKLTNELLKKRVNNVEVHPPVPRAELSNYYEDADVLFLHLDSFENLSRVIPSKVFEYAATGLPMICGVQGFTRKFIETNISNAATFPPNDVDGCISKLSSLRLEVSSREVFCARFSRKKIMSEMTSDIGNLLFQS
ncbi:glycosyltransferase family 4 protein [Vibrio sp. HN007]|uniref:glycosyltransferase family 4 protein n=1 Tax=Vibrio iocasae TaxID=3098914 RepID=UPI0035D490FE